MAKESGAALGALRDFKAIPGEVFSGVVGFLTGLDTERLIAVDRGRYAEREMLRRQCVDPDVRKLSADLMEHRIRAMQRLGGASKTLIARATPECLALLAREAFPIFSGLVLEAGDARSLKDSFALLMQRQTQLERLTLRDMPNLQMRHFPRVMPLLREISFSNVPKLSSDILRHMPHGLERLRVEGNMFRGEHSLAHVPHSAAGPSLRSIEVRRSSIVRDADVLALATLPHLERVVLEECRSVMAGAVETLRAQRPELELHIVADPEQGRRQLQRGYAFRGASVPPR